MGLPLSVDIKEPGGATERIHSLEERKETIQTHKENRVCSEITN